MLNCGIQICSFFYKDLTDPILLISSSELQRSTVLTYFIDISAMREE